MIEIISANTTWCEDDILNADERDTKRYFAQKRELYRQLKFASDKQGNRFDFLKFKSLEMRYFKKESFEGVKWWKRLFEKDRFILIAGMTNNYGQNWYKPIIISIPFSLLFYCIIIVDNTKGLSFCPNFTWNSIKYTFGEIWNQSKVFWQLLNPTHNLNKIFEDENNLTSASFVFSYLQKISIAFFGYQAISAFRKFNKR